MHKTEDQIQWYPDNSPPRQFAPDYSPHTLRKVAPHVRQLALTPTYLVTYLRHEFIIFSQWAVIRLQSRMWTQRHLDAVNKEAFRRHLECWRYWNPDFHLSKRCSRLHFVNKKLNLDCMFEEWFQIWIPNTQSRLCVQKRRYTWHFLNKKLNFNCLFEKWFCKYRINWGFMFKSVASLASLQTSAPRLRCYVRQKEKRLQSSPSVHYFYPAWLAEHKEGDPWLGEGNVERCPPGPENVTVEGCSFHWTQAIWRKVSLIFQHGVNW